METKLNQLWVLLKDVLWTTFSLKEGTDIQGASETICDNIPMRGANIWMLITSCILACIGLDLNSAAVIIGAMLISPLMGPILGFGFSAAIHDRQVLIRSVVNLAVTVSITVLTSFIYFSLTPLGEMTDEISGRIRPTLLDVFIAIAGGTAGIIACSRKKVASAIPGVAIATALMPPLCVTGYGLATHEVLVAANSFYLYLINAFFVALATYVVVEVLGFPHKQFFGKEAHKKMHKWVLVAVVVIIIPSCVIFYQVIRDLKMNGKVQAFIEKEVEQNNRELIKWEEEFSGNLRIVKVFLLGLPIDKEEQELLTLQMKREIDEQLQLEVVQVELPPTPEIKENPADALLTSKVLEYTEQLQEQEKELNRLKLSLLKVNQESNVLNEIVKEVELLFPQVEEAWYGLMLPLVTSEVANKPMLMVRLKLQAEDETSKAEQMEKLREFVQLRLGKEAIEVLEQPALPEVAPDEVEAQKL